MHGWVPFDLAALAIYGSLPVSKSYGTKFEVFNFRRVRFLEFFRFERDVKPKNEFISGAVVREIPKSLPETNIRVTRTYHT